MRDYTPTKGEHTLPHSVYMATLWRIRDYPRIKAEAEGMLASSPAPPDGQPRGTKTVNPVETTAERRERHTAYLKVVDGALSAVPPEYRRGVWENIQKRKPYPMDAGRATYSRWKTFMIYRVAVGLGLYEDD